MTTKEKALYDFQLATGQTIVFLQLNFNNFDGSPRDLNIVFEHDSFWKEAQRFPLPGPAIPQGESRWAIYERPIVATWKVTGRGLPIPNVSIY